GDLERWHVSFRAFCWKGSDPVQELRQLSELCHRWLRPDLHSTEQILDRLVLEQLLITAPEDLQVQIWENRVQSCEELEELLQGHRRPLGSMLAHVQCTGPVPTLGVPSTRVRAQAGTELSSSGWDCGASRAQRCPGRQMLDTRSLGGARPQSIVICEGQKFLLRAEDVEMANQAGELDVRMDSSTELWSPEGRDQAGAEQPWGQGEAVLPEAASKEGHPEVLQKPLERELGHREDVSALEAWEPLLLPGPGAEGTQHHHASPEAENEAAERVPGGEPLSPRRPRKRSPDQALSLGGPQAGAESPEEQGGVNSAETLRSPGAAARPAPHCCSTCSKTYLYRSQLVIHERSHTGERPFRCDQCNKGFMQPSDLRVHLRIHTGERPFHCCLCPKAFTHESTLLGHLRMHTREQPYVCEHCGKSFSHRGNLNVHMRIHTQAKPYRCPVCGHAFRQLGTMKRHCKIHVQRSPGDGPAGPEPQEME
ncbi:zinc finger and SCAN domain-containing protein 5B, partial [Heterocephalus glaber]|uniref:Zinc finger and SCAN domain-containing protein 5B n=1 Tax=Heterocephalus glaber TaxID=10181 RepID=A0AAX6Q449_HETGA